MFMLCAPMAVFAQKFGHVDSQAVMQGLPDFIKARGDLEIQSKQYENDLKAMQDEIKRKTDDYEKTASTMNETKRKETETEIQGMIEKYQQALQTNQQAFQKLQQEKMQPIIAKVTTAIKNVGQKGGYVYIMDMASGIPYISETLSKDVTNEVNAEIKNLK